MILIMKTEFENLQKNCAHSFETDTNTDKQVVKVYRDDALIAKKIKIKKSIRYFGVQGYKAFLSLS
ncbi:hypothetical protein [Zhongshania sp. BJYM1]|jgi:hypothetical protein|uniref:hypothetical protein n=1 Tax=Zhongshania aquatica TaxID=2965069 RepID=UPI0022B2FCEE|nr:hypothetical protein [Marortus sp. BJYM1]